MNIQRLRNLTTGILHTNIKDVYEDIEFLTSEQGVMTHQLSNAFEALNPWLRSKIQDERFWDGKFDTEHTGEIEITPMTVEERLEFFKRYISLPSPLFK